MKSRISILAVLLLSFLHAFCAPKVSVLTALPGLEIYELEGHTALRLQDPANGMDVVVNWGVFDFNTPNFVYRFCKGETDYLCMASPTQLFLAQYRMQGRQVVEQFIEMDSLQTETLMGLLEENLKPQNATYRYNYVKDNCATRPLLMLEQALGRQLVPAEETDKTFRKEMTRYHANYPWYQFGIDLALGRGIDEPIDSREAIFAPVELMEALRQSGAVTEEQTIGRHTAQPQPTPWYLTPLALSLLILILTIAITIYDLKRGKSSRWFDTLLFGLFFVLGCILTFLIFVSTHEATSPNLLLLWLNPLCLLGALLPWIKKAKNVEFWYFFANFALLIVLAVLAPLMGRSMNAAFWPLMAADALRSAVNMLICRKKPKLT